MDFAKARRALADGNIGGWLFYYFQNNDPIAARLLGVSPDHFSTRRWFYLLPRRGAPVKIVHAIEPHALDHLPGRRRTYASWKSLHARLGAALKGLPTVAMQYSPRADVPTVSRVDAGTVELVRSLGPRVVSSGDLIQRLECVLTPAQAAQHARTARQLRRIVLDAFAFAGKTLRAGKKLTEGGLQKEIIRGYRRHGLLSNSPPIVAVNGHSGRPHYVLQGEGAAIRKGDWLLLDIWAKPDSPQGVYADITWCGYAGITVPAKYEERFRLVARARNAALALVDKRCREGKPLAGWEVDRAARRVIERAGQSGRFIHRTGHSMHTDDHAAGANMDSLESRETRRVLPGTLFSIEPGVYGKDFGVRSEINVYIDGKTARVTGGPPQARVVPFL